MHPDFELDWSRAMGTNQGLYRADQVRRFFDDFAETFESRLTDLGVMPKPGGEG